MAEESDARIERLKKAYQESREHKSEMMEIIKILVREKGQPASPSPQNETAHHEQRREENTYPTRFLPRMVQQGQTRAFPYG